LGYKINVPKKNAVNSRNNKTANSLHRSANITNKSTKNTELKKRNSLSESEQKAQTNKTSLKSRKYDVKDTAREEENQIKVKQGIIE
jgi:hypothetical protein